MMSIALYFFLRMGIITFPHEMEFIDLALVSAIETIIYGIPFLTGFQLKLLKLLHVLHPEII